MIADALGMTNVAAGFVVVRANHADDSHADVHSRGIHQDETNKTDVGQNPSLGKQTRHCNIQRLLPKCSQYVKRVTQTTL